MKSGHALRQIAVGIWLGLLLHLGGLDAAEDSGRVWREDFDSIDAWHPLTFLKIGKHTRYSIQALEGESVLKAEADASASGLVHTKAFDPFVTPVLRWRWRVENFLKQGDATRKDGDDYPFRVYILFDYDPERASLGMRTKYAVARRLYGEYPPHASLNYIWANQKHARRSLPSPYTDRSQMTVLRADLTKPKNGSGKRQYSRRLPCRLWRRSAAHGAPGHHERCG